MSKNYDDIIIGQGICGTFLSYYLHKAGRKVLVIDAIDPASASRVASGVINPVTGRSVVTTWMAQVLLPFAEKAYTDIGNAIGQKVLLNAEIAAFTSTEQMQSAFEKRMNEENGFIHPLDNNLFSSLFQLTYKSYLIKPGYVIDLHALLIGWRNYLQQNDLLITDRFAENELQIKETSVCYKEIEASTIFYCNGTAGFQSSYWNQLPYALNKGQALIIETELPIHHVYKFGAMSLVPWDNNTWWVGSSYENNFSTEEPTEDFRLQAEAQLRSILKKPFTVVDHIAGVRPAVIVERRPFAGFHPHVPNVGILNGMGTKGCSLAPYFAHQLTENIINGTPLEPSADVQRFKRILQTKNSTE